MSLSWRNWHLLWWPSGRGWPEMPAAPAEVRREERLGCLCSFHTDTGGRCCLEESSLPRGAVPGAMWKLPLVPRTPKLLSPPSTSGLPLGGTARS